MPQESHERELEQLARGLAALVPSTGSLDRDRILFQAGQASRRGSLNIWRSGTLAALLAAAAIFVVDRIRPAPVPVETLVYVPVEVPAKEAQETFAPDSAVATARPGPSSEPTVMRQDDSLSAYQLQETVMRDGFEGLPLSGALASAGPVLSAEDWRQGRFSDLFKP